jgi:benzoyl-CoA 2,3-dioxygenase component B
MDAGGYATWIAPPRMGINHQPVDYEYVKIA